MARKAESKARPRRRRNPELAVRHVARPGIPASRFNLTPQERALLPDPDRVTEDDADAIISLRRERTEKPIPLERVLKRYGYRVEG
jgi:hypothetical protein